MRGFNSQEKTAPGGDFTLNGDDKGIPAHTLMTEIMGTVPTFGGVKVTVGFFGEEAFCSAEHKYVNLPALPPTQVIPTPIAREIRGFAAHEAAHLMFTDFSIGEKLKAVPDADRALLKEIWNAIEDFMIERNFLSIYPGAHKNFTETERRCCIAYFESYKQNPDIAKDLRRIGPVALTWARAIDFGLKTPLSKDAMNTLPASLRQRVWDWYDDILDVEVSDDCFECAKLILEDIKAQPYDPLNPPQQQPQNQNNAQGQSGQGQQSQGSAGSQSGGGKSAKSGQGKSGAGGKNGKKGTGTGSGTGGNQGSSNGAPQSTGDKAPDPYPVGHTLDKAYQDMGIKTEDQNRPVSVACPSSAHAGVYKDILGDPGGLTDANAQKQACADTIGSVSRILRRALKSIAKDRWKGGRADGRIDDKRLAQVHTGNHEIYRKKIAAPKIDTAVSILIDCSGSMKSIIGICQQLGLIMQGAFQGTPIKFEIIGYTTGDVTHLPDHLKTMADAIAARNNSGAGPRGISIYEFKGFDSPFLEATTTLGNMPRIPLGGTPTADALLIAHQRLSKRRERRHVIFAVTDGQSDDKEMCRRAVRMIESRGCSVLGIGINSTSVKSEFGRSVVINSASDLTAVVMSEMAGMLLKDYKLKGQPARAIEHIVS